MPRILALTLAALSLSACATDDGERRFDLDELVAQRERDVENFHRAQGALEARTEIPMRLDYEDAGAVFIDRLAIVGRPGKAFLRMHFTWVNTSGRPYPVVDARLTLRDALTETEWSETLEMRLPYRYNLTAGSSYTSWFETPTRGVHLREGWDWRLEILPHDRDPLWDQER